MKARSLFPLFDAAYLGINSGDFAKDAAAIRYFVEDMGMNTAICLSFAKNMGLYGMIILPSHRLCLCVVIVLNMLQVSVLAV